MRRDQRHAQRTGGEHHGDVHIAREMRQQLRETGIAEAGQVEGVLVHRAGDDGVDLSLPGQLHGLLYRLTRETTGLFGEQGARSGSFPSPLPTPDHNDVSIKRTQRERFGHHLRPDPPRVAGCHGEAGTAGGGHAARTGRRRRSCGAAGRGSV